MDRWFWLLIGTFNVPLLCFDFAFIGWEGFSPVKRQPPAIMVRASAGAACYKTVWQKLWLVLTHSRVPSVTYKVSKTRVFTFLPASECAVPHSRTVSFSPWVGNYTVNYQIKQNPVICILRKHSISQRVAEDRPLKLSEVEERSRARVTWNVGTNLRLLFVPTAPPGISPPWDRMWLLNDHAETVMAPRDPHRNDPELCPAETLAFVNSGLRARRHIGLFTLFCWDCHGDGRRYNVFIPLVSLP